MEDAIKLVRDALDEAFTVLYEAGTEQYIEVHDYLVIAEESLDSALALLVLEQND